MKNHFLIYFVIFIGILFAIPQHKDRIVDITISNDKTKYATASKDGKIIIWDNLNQKTTNSFNIDSDKKISQMTLNATNQLLAIGFNNGDIDVINLTNNQIVSIKTTNNKIVLLKCMLKSSTNFLK